MRLPAVAAALLMASLAACGPAGTEGPHDPAAADATAGTAPAPEPVATTQADSSTCGADKLARWLNVLPTDDVRAGIVAAVGDRPIRTYTQGDPITMDFNAARLNVELGVDGRIKMFRCG